MQVYVIVGGLGNDDSYLKNYARKLARFHGTLVSIKTLDHKGCKLCMDKNKKEILHHILTYHRFFNDVTVIGFSSSCMFLAEEIGQKHHQIRLILLDYPNIYSLVASGPQINIEGYSTAYCPLIQTYIKATGGPSLIQRVLTECFKLRLLLTFLSYLNPYFQALCFKHILASKSPFCVDAKILKMPLNTLRTFLVHYIAIYNPLGFFRRNSTNHNVSFVFTGDQRYRMFGELISELTTHSFTIHQYWEHHILYQNPEHAIGISI